MSICRASGIPASTTEKNEKRRQDVLSSLLFQPDGKFDLEQAVDSGYDFLIRQIGTQNQIRFLEHISFAH